ncbi:hypothetical protein TKK_0010935 [Trichogramma kaykai]|uniref:RBR-type E3 ubiquitin transferase n=1 Tax=Trichogramma kaykai TaxID=54128 RepID=A0ABD2WW80_9HYME
MDSEQQKDEINALESIYQDEEFSYHIENDLYQVTLKIFILLPDNFSLNYKVNIEKGEENRKIIISHLPPLTLLITLPSNYPSKAPPKFILRSSWLDRKSSTKLCQNLDNIWKKNPNQEILFSWICFLQNETLEILKIHDSYNIDHLYNSFVLPKIDAPEQSKPKIKHFAKNQCALDKRAILDKLNDCDPVQMLIDYNSVRKKIIFRKNFHSCKICFSDKVGENCTQFLPCEHIFCKDCIAGYLEIKIKEGEVSNILCPEDNCSSEVSSIQVKDLVSNELFSKYDSLLLSTALDTMTDTIYCPRKVCQYPASKESTENMATCPNCFYSFCTFCKSVYHGINPCKTIPEEKLKILEEYKNGSPEEKAKLEMQYGKKQLQTLLDTYLSEQWLRENSKDCPKCSTSIEKSDGCNKMSCWKCSCYFCWICLRILDKRFPYAHYRDEKSPCFNLLFHGVERNDHIDDYEDVDDNDDDDDDDDVNDDDDEGDNNEIVMNILNYGVENLVVVDGDVIDIADG